MEKIVKGYLGFILFVALIIASVVSALVWFVSTEDHPGRMENFKILSWIFLIIASILLFYPGK